MLSSPTKIHNSAFCNTAVHQKSISEEMAGQRLDNYLITYLKGVPKTRIYRMIRKGEVRVNKGRAKPDYRLMANDVLRIPPVRRNPANSSDGTETSNPSNLPFKTKTAAKLLNCILYEDDNLMILNKPAGMAVHGGSGVSLGVIEALRVSRTLNHEKQVNNAKEVNNAKRVNNEKLELVHRLDRETSGCLIIAKRRQTLRAIHELLREGKIEKLYWALVKGVWIGDKIVEVPLKKNQLSSGERIVKVSENGQNAKTEFRVLKEYATTTLLEAKPITGRTHQIRVHATYAGSPIVGDPKYGDAEFNQIMKGKGLSRLFLHARKISFILPGYSEPISVEAPLDPDFSLGLERL